eukprot:3022616-Amphidinium_carterae.1
MSSVWPNFCALEAGSWSTRRIANKLGKLRVAPPPLSGYLEPILCPFETVVFVLSTVSTPFRASNSRRAYAKLATASHACADKSLSLCHCHSAGTLANVLWWSVVIAILMIIVWKLRLFCKCRSVTKTDCGYFSKT